LDSLRYAYTEAAEAMDVYLRESRPDDARNHERDNNMMDELADCAIMLLTALDPDYEFRPSNTVHSAPSIDDIAGLVASSLANWKYWYRLKQKHGKANEHIWQEPVLLALGAIEAYYPNMDLVAEIEARLGRIKRKHVPEDAW
jgi:hypothetical protein